MYAFAVGAALLNFAGENAGHAQNVVGPGEYPSVDPSRETFHEQAAGALESRELIHFEHHRPLQPFPQQHAHKHEVSVPFIEHGVRLPPQNWQQPKWEKQVVEKLEHFKYELRTLAAYVFPN